MVRSGQGLNDQLSKDVRSIFRRLEVKMTETIFIKLTGWLQ